MKKRNYGIIIALLLIIGVGYAYLTTTLTINGIAKFSKNEWKIVWEDVTVLPDSITITADEKLEENGGYYDAHIVSSSATSEDDTIEYKVPLKKPRDTYHFTAYMSNKGSIDAMITEEGVKELLVPLTNEEKKYIQYEVKYANGNEIKPYDALRVDERRLVDVYLRYRDDMAVSELPAELKSREFVSTFEFVQANANANYVQVAPLGDATVTKTGTITGEVAPIVKGSSVVVNGAFASDGAEYVVTTKFKNYGSKAVNLTEVKTTGVNEDVVVTVKDNNGEAITSLAAGAEVTAVIKLVADEAVVIDADHTLAFNAPSSTATIELVFSE